MKTKELSNERPFSGSIMALCTFIYLTGMAFFYTGCGSDDGDETEISTGTTDPDTTDPSGYKMFTSVSALKSWIGEQPINTSAAPYKAGLKGVNLDSGDNWGDMGVSVSGPKYVDLDLTGCTGTAIPDGHEERTTGKPGEVIVTTFGAFIECEFLLSVKLPKTLETVGKWAFYKCTSLRSVTFPEGLDAIHDYAFEGCSKLDAISLPNGLKNIGASAFENCGLTSITIPGTVTEWDSSSFSNCRSLLSVTINEGATTIGEHTFWNCSSLASVLLPATLKRVKREAFRNCGSLETITLPDGVESIGANTFLDCILLSSINIPDNVKNIEDGTFRNCKKLKNTALPKDLEYIGEYSFDHCEAFVSSIEIPSKVAGIGYSAFGSSGISTFIMRPATPPTLGSTALVTGAPFASLVIKVPAASLNKYKTAGDEWERYTTKIVADTD